EVLLRLVGGDEGGGAAQFDRLLLGGVEGGVAGGVAVPCRSGSAGGGGGVELAVDEHAGAAGPAGSAVHPAGDRTVGRDLQTGVAHSRAHAAPAGRVGEGEPVDGGVVGGSDGSGDAVLEGDRVQVRPGGLVLVPECEFTVGQGGGGFGSGGREDGELVAVAHPDTGLVGEADRLQGGQVLGIVVALVGIQGAGGGGIGHRGDEVESDRHGHGREVVAPGETAGGVRAAAGVHVGDESLGGVQGSCRDDADVVEVPGDGGSRRGVRLVIGEHDGLHRPTGEGAQVHRHGVPLAGPKDVRLALGACGDTEAVGVLGVGGREPGAVGEDQVHGRMGGAVGEVGVEHGEDGVMQFAVLGDLQVHIEELVGGGGVAVGQDAAGIAQGLYAGEPHPGFGGGGGGGPVGDLGDHGRRWGLPLGVEQVPVRQLQVVVAVIGGDLQAVVGVVGATFGQFVGGGDLPVVTLLGGPGLAGADIQVVPGLAIGRPLHGEVLGVTVRGVVGRGDRVPADSGGLGEFVGQRAGSGEHEPFGVRVAVSGVRGDSVRFVLVRGTHGRNEPEQAVRAEHSSGEVDRILLEGSAGSGLGVTRLEG